MSERLNLNLSVGSSRVTNFHGYDGVTNDMTERLKALNKVT
jgi:hypothetical protein